MAANSKIQPRADTSLGEVVAFVVAPLVVLAASAAWAWSDMTLSVGPSGRLLIAVGAIALVTLVGRPLSAGPSIAMAAGAALTAGGVAVLLLSFAVNRVGCSPAGPLDVALHLAPVGAAATLGLFATLAAAIVGGRHGPAVGALAATGAGFVATVLAFATLVASFPGLSCAYVPA
jgi:hypothetical protein